MIFWPLLASPKGRNNTKAIILIFELGKYNALDNTLHIINSQAKNVW
jgi:hypothetical protein